MSRSEDKRHCFSIVWSIDQLKFSPLRAREMLCSPYFEIGALGATQWRLVLFPKGTLREDYMSLYLHRKRGRAGLTSVTLNFELSMDTLAPDLCHLRVARDVCFREDDFWGYPMFVKLNHARLITNTSHTRSFTIRCDLSPSDDLAVDAARDSRLDSKALSDDLKRLYDAQKLSDVVLRSGETEFRAHRAVLAARSPEFFRLLELDEPVPARDVSFISSPVLKTLLFYFYSGELDVPVSEIPRELLTVAEQFQLPDLVAKMRTFPNAYYARTSLNVAHKSVLWDVKRVSELESRTLSFVRVIPTRSLYVRNLGMCCQVVSDSDRGPIERINASFRLEGVEKDLPVFFRCKILGSETEGLFWEFVDEEHVFESEEEWHVKIPIGGSCCGTTLPSVSCLDFEFDLCDGVSYSRVQDDWTSSLGGLAAYDDFDQLSRDFEGLRCGRALADVSVVCAGRVFGAHRTVLAARSPVFEKMFEHDFVECRNGVVRVPDVRSEVMELMLSYAYGGKVDDLTYEDASDLYEAADKYGMIVLKEKCAAFLLAQMSTENAHEILFLADMHFDSGLKEKVANFLSTMTEFQNFVDSAMESPESSTC